MILGGSRYALPVIEAAHKLGIYVITCDYLPDNIAHKYSDEYCNISIIDKDNGIVKIEHTQEIPEYKKTSIIKSKEVRNNLKVFVILEAEYATMLLASEY